MPFALMVPSPTVQGFAKAGAFAFARGDAYVDVIGVSAGTQRVDHGGMLMDAPNNEFAFAGSLEELKAKGRLVVHGGHRPILVIYDRGRVFALDNRCPHMGFPLERGSVEDGILTCHLAPRPLRSRKRL